MSTTWCCRAWRSDMCCARLTRMPAYARSTRRAPTAAPGVLAVLTGADWRESGWGDLPVPGGLRRRGGAAAYRHPFPALARDRVRWVGDYVAFVVAETRDQAADAAELIDGRIRDRCRPSSRARRRSRRTRRASGKTRPDNICFVHEVGDRAAVEAAFARADRIVRRRFVVNRVTAAAMEPRGAIGDYNPADGRYTIYTTLQRTHAYRADLAADHQGAGKPHPGRRRRYRRQLRHEIGDLQRGRAGAAGLEAARTAGQVDQHPLRGVSVATRRRATMSPRPSWRSTATGISSPSARARSPRSAPTRSRTRTCS